MLQKSEGIFQRIDFFGYLSGYLKKMPSDTSVFSIVAYSVNVKNMCRNEIESACMICDVFPFHNYSFRVVSEAASELHPWYFWKAT